MRKGEGVSEREQREDREKRKRPKNLKRRRA